MAGCIFFSGTRQDDPVNKPNLKLFLVSLKLNKKESRCQVGYPPPKKKKISKRGRRKRKNGKGMFKIYYVYIWQTHETHCYIYSSYMQRKAPF